MDRWKAEMGRGREKRRVEESRSEKRKSQKKKDADSRKGRKVAIHCVFPMICGSGGSKSRLAKAAGAEPAGQRRDEKLHAVVARSTFSTFGSWGVEKVHAVVARSTFRIQNVQNTSSSDHFWKLRCRKKCTLLWHEAHFQVKMYKAHQLRTTFGGSDVEKVHAVVARSTFRSQNVKNTRGSDHFWRFRCRFASLHYTTLHYTPLHSSTLHYTTLPSTTLRYTKLHYIPLHSTTLHYITLHYITLNDTAPQIDK